MTKSTPKTPETTMDKFKKFVKSKRFKTMCDENGSLRNFDDRNIDSLLTLKHLMDETLSWKEASKDIRNCTYLQHVIGGMVEDYVNFCDMQPKKCRSHEQPTKNVYAPLPKKEEKTAPEILRMNNTSLKTYLGM